MGTLAAVLAGKKVRTFKDQYKAIVTGDIEDVDGVLKITHINVEYHLKLPKEKREDASEALENYIKLCPAAQSVIGCINIRDNIWKRHIPY